MFGFDAADHIIVGIEFAPVYAVVYGAKTDVEFVKYWIVSPEHARRIAMVAAWNHYGNHTAGNA